MLPTPPPQVGKNRAVALNTTYFAPPIPDCAVILRPTLAFISLHSVPALCLVESPKCCTNVYKKVVTKVTGSRCTLTCDVLQGCRKFSMPGTLWHSPTQALRRMTNELSQFTTRDTNRISTRFFFVSKNMSQCVRYQEQGVGVGFVTVVTV